MLRSSAAIPISAVVQRIERHSRRLGMAAVPSRPMNSDPGNSTPADMSGEAHPTIHSGGTALATSAAAAPNGRNETRQVQQTVHGTVRTSAAKTQTRREAVPIAGQYIFAVATRGTDAAA
jgi:hypothetical protein